MTLPTDDALESFYLCAALGLRHLEQREGRGRRFGEAAIARWRAFSEPRGSGEGRALVRQADRLELLLRDAAVTSPLAFSARPVFGLEALAGDEPFGHEWPGAGDERAARCLAEAARAEPISASELLERGASAWHLGRGTSSPALDALVAELTPATRVVCAGLGALLAVASRVLGGAPLELGEQVLLVAHDPGPRQVFGLALLASGSRARPLLLPSTLAGPAVSPTSAASPTSAGAPPSAASAFVPHVVLVSPDASPRDAEAARALVARHGARTC